MQGDRRAGKGTTGTTAMQTLSLLFVLTLLAGCGGNSGSEATPPLSTDNLNLIFVVSPDLAYQAPGDVDPGTANLTSQGLQRSLLMAAYLKSHVLGAKNVTSIYTLIPMTHLQNTPTNTDIPDMTAIGYIQQFALLNQKTLPVDASGTMYTANSFPLNAAYAPGSVPNNVVVPSSYCPDCTGLDFNNTAGNNDTLVSGIIGKKTPGYYVFSAPWETTRALLAKINGDYGYNLNIPTTYKGPNYVYALSIPPSGNTRLITYNSNLTPPATYPALPAPVASAACTHSLQPYFNTIRIGGLNGATIPDNINKNERIYIIRHAEAHPDPTHHFEDGNYVAAGQWRALALANALRNQISPNVVYSIDPSQWAFTGAANIAYVRPSLTVLPYAIANNLPYRLVSTIDLGTNPTDPALAKATSDFFFTNGTFSNQTVLLAWESGRIKPFINALLASYGGNNLPLLPTAWPSADYDTIWSVTLDAQGNLTVDNALCEGIDSTQLPATAPLF